MAVRLSIFTHFEQHLKKEKSEGHKLGTGLQLSAGVCKACVCTSSVSY